MEREEAIKKVRQMSLPKETMEILEVLIPELRESEDERIRKHLIEIVETYWGTTNDPGKAADLAYLEKQKEQPTNEEMLRILRTEYEKGVADTIAKYEQKEPKPEHFELKAGKWYFCHHAFCCRADLLTVQEGERFMCEKDGVVKGFVIKEPEKYFIECSAPAPMEDEQKEQPISAVGVLVRAGLKPYKDGNQWCVLAGDNIQEGICRFGDTIEDALYEFLKEVLDLQKDW